MFTDAKHNQTDPRVAEYHPQYEDFKQQDERADTKSVKNVKSCEVEQCSISANVKSCEVDQFSIISGSVKSSTVKHSSISRNGVCLYLRHGAQVF